MIMIMLIVLLAFIIIKMMSDKNTNDNGDDNDKLIIILATTAHYFSVFLTSCNTDKQRLKERLRAVYTVFCRSKHRKLACSVADLIGNTGALPEFA